LEQPRGVGLACHALAEALRRMTNVPNLLRPETVFPTLERAKQLSEEAEEIFNTVIDEPLRLAEAKIELGCVCREWVRRLTEHDPKRSELLEMGEQALEEAVEIAGEAYFYRAIDALVNLAWLYYYIGDSKRAEELLANQVRKRIDDEYLYTTDHGVDKEEFSGVIPWIWVQLGKADLLLGVIRFDEYQRRDREKDMEGAEEYLRKAGHNWALSLSYDALFGDDFRDLDRGLSVLYDKIAGLNEDEMDWLLDAMEKTYQEYHVDESEQLLARFILNRFGY
jgi:hypothetical protein